MVKVSIMLLDLVDLDVVLIRPMFYLDGNSVMHMMPFVFYFVNDCETVLGSCRMLFGVKSLSSFCCFDFSFINVINNDTSWNNSDLDSICLQVVNQ